VLDPAERKRLQTWARYDAISPMKSNTSQIAMEQRAGESIGSTSSLRFFDAAQIAFRAEGAVHLLPVPKGTGSDQYRDLIPDRGDTPQFVSPLSGLAISSRLPTVA